MRSNTLPGTGFNVSMPPDDPPGKTKENKRYIPKYSVTLPEFETQDKIHLLDNLRKHDERIALRYMVIAAAVAGIAVIIMVLIGIQL